MPSFNLVRNSRVFFTTNVNASTGVVQTTSHTTATTKELMVLDGFTFSQGTNVDTIQISEAGNTPVRGQRSFNTSLNNVEFSFSTYIRPYNATTTVSAAESVLWNALLSSSAIGTAVTLTGATAATYATATGVLTISGTGMTYTGVTANGVYTMSGIGGSGASWVNAPVRVLTLSASSITLQVLNPTTTTLTLTAGAGIKFNQCAWTDNAAVSGDVQFGNVPYAQASTVVSNKNQLQTFGMIFVVDGVMYLVDNCAMDSATIDFGLDGIATVQWSGKGTALRSTDAPTMSTATDPVFTGTLTGTAYGKANTAVANAAYITNKLSTVELISNLGGIGGTTYTLALTGGSITVANNISYVTPANLGVVNTPIGYYTGTRSVSGSINAYLRTGTAGTAAILANMLSNAATSTEPKYQMKLDVGGSSNSNRVNLWIFGANLQIPTVDAQAVMSTTISFNAQGTADMATSSVSNYDLESTNDLVIKYFAA